MTKEQKKVSNKVVAGVFIGIIILISLVLIPGKDNSPPITYNPPAMETEKETPPELKFKTINLSGIGVKPTDPFELKSVGYKVTVTHEGESTFIVHLMDSSGTRIETIANEIGSTSLTRIISVEKGKYFFAIDYADGPWTIKIESL